MARRAHNNYRVRLQHRVEYFLRIAHQVNVDNGFDGRLLGERPESPLRVREGDIGLVERQRIGDDFQHQEADSPRKVLSKLCGGFERMNRFGDSGMKDDNLKRCLLTDNRPGERGHTREYRESHKTGLKIG